MLLWHVPRRYGRESRDSIIVDAGGANDMDHGSWPAACGGLRVHLGSCPAVAERGFSVLHFSVFN